MHIYACLKWFAGITPKILSVAFLFLFFKRTCWVIAVAVFKSNLFSSPLTSQPFVHIELTLVIHEVSNAKLSPLPNHMLLPHI